MNKLTYRFTLDTHKNGLQRVLQGFQTGENTARTMEITLKEGPENYTFPLDNITASMYVRRPSQTEPSINACSIDTENNKVIYDVLDQDISEAGVVELQLKIIRTVGTNITTLVSPKFGMEVWESNIEDSEAEGTTTYTALTEAIAEAEAMKDSAIADMYIDENNIITIVFGDGTEYTSTVIADAIARIDDVEEYALKSEGYAIGKQNGVDVGSTSPYFHNNSKYLSEQAASSAFEASQSESNAEYHKNNAATSATDALASKNAAATSESNAATSEANALTYKNAAATSEANALAYKNAAATSESNASTSASNASTSASNAATSESNASASASAASTSASNASTSASNASASATSASSYATLSQSYAVGGTGTRSGEDNDNAKHYKEQCEQIAAGMAGGLLPMGTVAFANLPTQNLAAGMMYNISDAFTSDSRFKDGGGKSYPAGTNAYVTADLMWDCFAGSLTTVNGHTGQSITLDGSDIKATGYSKASSAGAIASTDTINQALGKLEKKIDDETASSRVTSFNSRTGAVSPADGDYTGNMIPMTGYSKPSSTGAIVTSDKVNQAIGKLERKLDDEVASSRVTSFNGRTGAVTPSNSDYVGSDIKMTGYAKAQTSSPIATTDTVNSAMGKLEKKVDDNASNVSTALGVLTTVQNCAVGDTSVTFSDSAIHTTSIVELLTDNQTASTPNEPIAPTGYTTTEGSCVVTFDALEKATSMRLWIHNL